jgi:hypothetical protein
MAVMVPRECWTDQRLDDLNHKVDGGFSRLDSDVREVRAEMKELRGEMNARFEALDARFDALQRTLFGGAVAIVVAVIGSNAF